MEILKGYAGHGVIGIPTADERRRVECVGNGAHILEKHIADLTALGIATVPGVENAEIYQLAKVMLDANVFIADAPDCCPVTVVNGKDGSINVRADDINVFKNNVAHLIRS